MATMADDTEFSDEEILQRVKYGQVPTAHKSSFAPNILAAIHAKGTGWTPAVARNHQLRFISISPAFSSVRICCRACGKVQAYGSFEGHAKNCKAEMWHLTSRLTEQEVAEGKDDEDDIDDSDTKKKRPGKKGTDNKNQWLDMFPNHRGVFRDGGGKKAIYWANRGDGNMEDGFAYVIHPDSVAKIRGICYVCGWFATLNKMRDHMDYHRDNYYGGEYTVLRLHCGKPIIDHRLSLEESDEDDADDAKMPARATKTAEDQGDGAEDEDSDAFFDADEEEVEEVLTQGEKIMFEAVVNKNSETWDQDIQTQQTAGEDSTNVKKALERTKEKEASKRKPKRKKVVEEEKYTAPKTRSKAGNRRITRNRGN